MMITPFALTEPTPSPLLNVRTIYTEAGVPDYPRGQEILDRFPQAERIIVPSHWQIPALHGNDALIAVWNTTKRTVLVLGVKKTLKLSRSSGARISSRRVRRMAARWRARTATLPVVKGRQTRSRPL